MAFLKGEYFVSEDEVVTKCDSRLYLALETVKSKKQVSPSTIYIIIYNVIIPKNVKIVANIK